MYDDKLTEYFKQRNYEVTPEEMYYIQNDCPQISIEYNAKYNYFKFWTNKDLKYHDKDGKPFEVDENREWIAKIKK